MTNEAKIIATYLEKIFDDNKVAISSVMGNIQAESNFRANNLQNGYEKKFGLSDEEYTAQVDSGKIDKETFMHDSAGYGLCQWTHWSRKQTLYDFAKGERASIGSLEMQCEYLNEDLTSRYNTLYNNLCAETGTDYRAVYRATKEFMLKYEKPANQTEANIERRAKLSWEIYQELTSKETEINDIRNKVNSAVAVIEMKLDEIKEALKKE